MLIYSHINTPRTKYVLDLLFGSVLGLTYRFTDNRYVFEHSTEPRLAYTNDRIGEGVFIRSHTLLSETGISRQETDVFDWEDLPVFFKTAGDLPFDVFAATFYLVTRYEEYFPHETDAFGRYQAKNSLAVQHHFLQKAVINRWAARLKKLLVSFYPSLAFQTRQFKALLTIDIDVAFAFKGRSVKRNLLASFNDLFHLRPGNIGSRLKCLLSGAHDPYDTYDNIIQSLKGSGIPLLVFFLLSQKNNAYDRNLPAGSSAMKSLLKKIAAVTETGIHPSYFSSERPQFITEEKKQLEQIIGKPVTKSRQHFLRFRLPDTFRHLEREGITDDYSMGYAELPGFRAGICTPFRFYDLMQEQVTGITIHPITYMDGTFIEDMRLSPEEAISIGRRMIDEVRAVNGNFIAIWHNHTVSDKGIYKGWKAVYSSTIKQLKEK